MYPVFSIFGYQPLYEYPLLTIQWNLALDLKAAN